ncbi:DUF4097 family beta strand repeat-containing protein [Nonomuraea zeae]|uniref:DUF4097 domain-containing protein n=1 Tax=Nonomuraea zeae TaxID=1642303 RepID=A0A5S4F5D6_9ACTN|nr:DUF4097 family beta strand repeat-containing protein [Nonomuraea zeae]TMR11329.1 DUF4097 domain-containing protein [Nonomuraea zeae]
MPTFATPEPITAVIDLATAKVRINASDRADTVVEVYPSDQFNDADVQAAEHARIEYTNGTLRVKAPAERTAAPPGWGGPIDLLVEGPMKWARSLLGWGGSVEVTIDLPAGSHIEANAAADLRCRGRLGEVKFTTSYGDIHLDQADRLRLKTGSGDISVTRAAGHADVTTANGDVRIGEVDGTAVVKTSNGHLTLGEVTGDLRLNTAYGDITVARALAGVAAKTAYGSVRIGEVVSGSVVMETAGGALELGIREGSAAWLDVSSQYGTVEVSLDACDGPAPSDKTVEVRAHTAYGDIAIHRS